MNVLGRVFHPARLLGLLGACLSFGASALSPVPPSSIQACFAVSEDAADVSDAGRETLGHVGDLLRSIDQPSTVNAVDVTVGYRYAYSDEPVDTGLLKARVERAYRQELAIVDYLQSDLSIHVPFNLHIARQMSSGSCGARISLTFNPRPLPALCKYGYCVYRCNEDVCE